LNRWLASRVSLPAATRRSYAEFIGNYLVPYLGRMLVAEVRTSDLQRRRGETAGLRWMDIDLDNGVLYVQVRNQRRDGEVVMCPPKTASGIRCIALDTTTTAALRGHREGQDNSANSPT
jgi:integrase